MKKFFIISCFALAVLTAGRVFNSNIFAKEVTDAPIAEESLVSGSLSFSYSSTYWWRGGALNDTDGVLWTGFGVDIGVVSLSYSAGVSPGWITDETTAEEDDQKSLTEMDYGLSFGDDLDILSLGVGVMYIQYPFFDTVDKEAADPSFFEASLSLALATILSPTVNFYYDYYIEAYESAETGEDVPTSEDYYITLSLSHDLISADDGFAVSISGLVGYYNDPYYELKGLSDAIVSIVVAKDYNDLSFSSAFNYGRTLGKEFKEANTGVKNHFWCDFGVSYAL